MSASPAALHVGGSGTKATATLRAGDVVLVVTHYPYRSTRATRQGDTTEWRTIEHTCPYPQTKWEYRDPSRSAKWDVYFTDGTCASTTVSVRWIIRCPTILGHEDEGGEHECNLPAGHAEPHDARA